MSCIEIGLEPTTRMNKASARLERAKGIEPSYAAWEAAVLPLNYARLTGDVCSAMRLFFGEVPVRCVRRQQESGTHHLEFRMRIHGAQEEAAVPGGDLRNDKGRRLSYWPVQALRAEFGRARSVASRRR
jgi:hypothetical protein